MLSSTFLFNFPLYFFFFFTEQTLLMQMFLSSRALRKCVQDSGPPLCCPVPSQPRPGACRAARQGELEWGQGHARTEWATSHNRSRLTERSSPRCSCSAVIAFSNERGPFNLAGSVCLSAPCPNPSWGPYFLAQQGALCVADATAALDKGMQ